MIIDNFTFTMICEEYYIDPFIALENQDVIKAIKNQDDVILAFLKTIPGELGNDLIHYHDMILNWNTSNENESFYYDAIENLTEDLIDKELL